MQICYTSKFKKGTSDVFTFVRDCKKWEECKKENISSVGGLSGDGLVFEAGACCWNDDYCNKLNGPELVENPQEIRSCKYPG